MTLSAGEIQQTTIARLALLIEEFWEHHVAKINIADGSALDSIESDWDELCKQTEQVYREMVSKMVGSTDERAIIAKKNGMARTRNKVENRQSRNNHDNDDKR